MPNLEHWKFILQWHQMMHYYVNITLCWYSCIEQVLGPARSKGFIGPYTGLPSQRAFKNTKQFVIIVWAYVFTVGFRFSTWTQWKSEKVQAYSSVSNLHPFCLGSQIWDFEWERPLLHPDSFCWSEALNAPEWGEWTNLWEKWRH